MTYKGTTIKDCPLLTVIDGDTIDVKIGDAEERLRLGSLDTEEKRHISTSKPKTKAGELATEFAEAFFSSQDNEPVLVDLEFDVDWPVEDCLTKLRGNHGRLLCFVYFGGVNYCLEAVRYGWSPYYMKYGHSRLYRTAFEEAEAWAKGEDLGIWDEATNGDGPRRDYDTLIPWWQRRAEKIDAFRNDPKGALSVRIDYDTLLQRQASGEQATIFCDLQNGIDKWVGNGAVIYAGSKAQRFNLWIPDVDDPAGLAVIEKLQPLSGPGKDNYVRVTGTVGRFRDTPQIVLTDPDQITL